MFRFKGLIKERFALPQVERSIAFFMTFLIQCFLHKRLYKNIGFYKFSKCAYPLNLALNYNVTKFKKIVLINLFVTLKSFIFLLR